MLQFRESIFQFGRLSLKLLLIRKDGFDARVPTAHQVAQFIRRQAFL